MPRIVCGGDLPYYNHGIRIEETPPNIWFYLNDDGSYTRDVYSDVPFILTQEDWKELHSHADGGCVGEPEIVGASQDQEE